MTSFILKIISCPIAVAIAAWLFPNVEYSNYTQIIIVGVILAVVGTMMEYMLLKRGTLWMSTIADFAASLLIIYFVSNLFQGAAVSFMGAALTAAIIAVVEYFTHAWLIKSGKTRKSPA